MNNQGRPDTVDYWIEKETKMRIAVVGLIMMLTFTSPLPYASAETAPRGQIYYWLWVKNMEGYWQDFIDFAAEQKVDGVVIWGLKGFGTGGEDRFCRELVKYAHARDVKVIHGLGLNGYEIGEFIIGEDSNLGATILDKFVGTQREKNTRRAVFCPSKPKSLRLLKECLLRAADTGVDGFNFETADVDYLTCHCPDCEKRFDSASETETTNKPVGWPLEHLQFAADVLLESRSDLWLNCEFAMQRFGKPPYTDNERMLRLNREIDPRITVVWAEHDAPPKAIATLLRKERENIGFYIRSGAIYGWNEKEQLSPVSLLPIARDLIPLDPVCVFYRSYRPTKYWSVNMGAAAKVLKNPGLTEDEVYTLVKEWQPVAKKRR